MVGNLDFLDFFLDFFTSSDLIIFPILFINPQETDLKSSTWLKVSSKKQLKIGTALRKHTKMHTHLKVI